MLENIHEKEVLPRGPEDEIIPSKISTIDKSIEELNAEIARIQFAIRSLTSDREMLITRAKEVGVTEDPYCRIVYTPVYPNKKVDVARLKELVPKTYEQICANVLSRIEDKFKAEKEKVGIFIAQSDVKAVIADKSILAMVIPEPSIPSEYKVSVVKKQ